MGKFSGSYELVNQSLQQTGKSPVLQRSIIDATSVVPSIGAESYDVSGYSRALVRVALGPRGPTRTARLTVPTFDSASTYTLTIGSLTPVVIATPASELALYEAILAALAAAAYAGYSAEIADDEESLAVWGPEATISWTAATGSPDLGLRVDYHSCRLRLYSSIGATALGGHTPTDAEQAAALRTPCLHVSCGVVHDYTVYIDGATLHGVDVAQVDNLYPRITGLTPLSGDACSPSAGGITYFVPQVYAAPGTLGGPL